MRGQWTLGPEHRYYGAAVVPSCRRAVVPSLPWLPDGSWSRFHAACLGHGGTELPHVAHGLCKRCYSARLRELERAADLELTRGR